MENRLLKTNDKMIDFIIAHVLTIVYFYNTGIPVIKWFSTDQGCLRNLQLQPIAALYKKVIHTKNGLRPVPGEENPCLKTTSRCIMTLSGLYRRLLSNLNIPDSFMDELQAIALLQLQFCMDSMTSTKDIPIDTSLMVLESGYHLIKTHYEQMKNLTSYTQLLEDLQACRSVVIGRLDLEQATTLELALTINTIVAEKIFQHMWEQDELLSKVSLEILSRKTRTGLFCKETAGYTPAPLGDQFFIMNALLSAYPFIGLDAVIEEVFQHFNRLYALAYKEIKGYFSYKTISIRYDAYEIGAILSALHQLGRYSSEDSQQKELIIQLKNSYQEFIINSYHEHFKQDLDALYHYYPQIHHSKKDINENHSKKDIRDIKIPPGVLFPKRIHLRFPGPSVAWDRKGILPLYKPLSLCISLLSVLENEASTESIPEAYDPEAYNIETDTQQLIKLLFELLAT